MKTSILQLFRLRSRTNLAVALCVGGLAFAFIAQAPAETKNEYEGFFGSTPGKNPFFAPPAAIPSTVIDWSLGMRQTKTLAANTTFTMTNMQDGQAIVLYITNTVGNYTVTYTAPAGHTIVWPGGSPPTETVGAKTDKIIFEKVGTVIYGVSTQNY